MGLWCWAWTHGVLGGRYAKRCRTAQGRGEAGQHGEDGDSGAEATGLSVSAGPTAEKAAPELDSIA